MSASRLSRRDALAAAGITLAGGAFALRDTGHVSGPGRPDAGPVTVILQDGRHVLPDVLQRQFAGRGAQVIALAEDPVRQWRGESAALLAARSTRLIGLTRWPEFLLVRGLAEESGRRVRYQRLDAASGAILWLIA